jgi:Carboxypeptidase regulatory-like domain
MARCSCLHLRFVSRCGLTLAAAAVFSACNTYVPAQGKERRATIATLKVSCEPQSDALQCRAIGEMAYERTDPRRETDLTDTATWSTSSVKTVKIVGARVTANEAGTAAIVASVRSGDETLTSSVLVVVDAERTRPQVAYDLTGVVREPSNNGIMNVEITLVDGGGHARTTVTSGADGAFRFVPLLTGQYLLRATKQGYRAVERPVNVPDPGPLTLVLLFEPN